MKRRDLMGASALVLGGVLGTTSAEAAGEVMVVYVGGWDCPPCTAWKNNEKGKWLASDLYKRVKYVEVESPRLKEVYREKYWSAEMLPVRKLIPEKDRWGTPRFLVVKNGKLISNQWGDDPWGRTLPVVRKAVGA